MTVATLISFPRHEDTNGDLCVYEGGQYVPFEIQRVFTVSAKAGDIRGDHAHRKCTQLLVCICGKVRVTCDDGSVTEEYILDSRGVGLLVPHGIWAKEEYLLCDGVLMVLCDQVYEAADYIRDYKDFKSFVEARGSR